MLRVRLPTPDLWQDKEHAERYASEYQCTVVEFNVEPVETGNAAQ
jgi:hypothetical protein